MVHAWIAKNEMIKAEKNVRSIYLNYMTVLIWSFYNEKHSSKLGS